MNRFIRQIFYILNSSALFILLVAMIVFFCEKSNNERQKQISIIAEHGASNMKAEAEATHLKTEKLKYQYYLRICNDPEYQSIMGE